MYLVSEFQFLVSPFMLYRMHGMYGGLPSWRNPAKHPTSPHGSMAAGDCSDAAVQGLCAGRGMVEARGRSCWGTAGAHRSKQRSYVRLRRNTGPKATRPPAWECWRTGKLQSTESPCSNLGVCLRAGPDTVLREAKKIPTLRTRMIVATVGLVCSDQLS